MPTFNWECPKGHQFDCYTHTREEVPPCPVKDEKEGPECASTGSEKIWGITKRSGYQRYPYKTKHLNGKEIEIVDASSEARIFKEHGVTQRDDAAYLEKEWLGYDFRTQTQRYKEGSGAGLPGCWV